MNKTIAVIAAHPDDEILGCGATIAKHIALGDEVHVLILAEGVSARNLIHDHVSKQAALLERQKFAKNANHIVGSTSLTLLDRFPDNRMDSVNLLEVVKTVETFIQKHKPSVIYTHHFGDLNIDHRITHQAVMTACRPEPNHCVKKILCFEINSSTEWQTPNTGLAFIPNWFEDVSDYLEKKLLALKAYETEMRNWPHTRSIEAVNYLAKLRGSSVGVSAAEAFMLMRSIN